MLAQIYNWVFDVLEWFCREIFKIFIIFFKMFFNDSNRLNQDIKLKLLGPLFKNHNFFLEV